MSLEEDIKKLIIKSLDLEDISVDDIEDEAPLFNEGLGLDSIDALELGMALKKQYNLPQLYTDAEPIKITQDSYIYPAKLLYWPSEDSYCIHHFDASWVDDYKITEKLSLRLGNGCLKLIRYKRQKTNASDIVLPNNQTLLFRIEKSSHRTFMLVWQKECA